MSSFPPVPGDPGSYPGSGGPPAGGGGPGWNGPPLADYGQRVIGGLIDYVAPNVPVWILLAISKPLGYLGSLAALAWIIYQQVQAGNTGQSAGKKIAGTRLVSETTFQPIGAGLAVARYFVHILDSLICLVGWLFPLWDPKRQTLADKILHTVVIVA